MTALHDTRARTARATPAGLRGLIRAVLRLHRAALTLWCLALVAATAVLIWMYAIADEARRGDVPCATPARAGFPGCVTIDAITVDQVYAGWIELVTTALAYAILPVAAWAGAALIGRELESGTAQLAWTQSVTPARWLAVKLAVPAVLLTSGTGVIVLLNVWARGDSGPNLVGEWYYPDVFVGTGPTAVAHPLVGLALGALAGLLLRRALPAAAVGFASTLVLYVLLDRFRAHLWPAVTRDDQGRPELPRSAWQLDDEGAGQVFHPVSHHWPLQLVESGVLLAVAAAATLAAFGILRRRTP
ncbi:hypothetical protein ACHBTE_31440 [Streptomyces sp. M41]|uniref:hypothetical protein n=1 Tax=Streptomyces sp. M41 TaxID=3059412 RepID=UPI00374CCC1C